jgi:membrane-bound lytic murein transglycosylase D
MQKYLIGYCITLTACATVWLFSSYLPPRQSAEAAKRPDGATAFQDIRAIKTPSSLDFCGESVPFENFDAKERFDRELHDNAYKYGSLLMVLKLSHRIFPVIEPIMAENGLPNDFKYLAVAESALRDATSPAGAKGIWQFMPATARQYGLVVNEEIDERFNLEKVTVAACKYLQDAQRRYGNWTLAAASYNAGMGGVSGSMTAQKGKSYYDISMTEETNRYLFRILAFKEIMQDPSKYGFYLDSDDYYNQQETSIVEVNGAANWGDFAAQYGTSYRVLKALNPWIVGNFLSNGAHKAYMVRVPRR